MAHAPVKVPDFRRVVHGAGGYEISACVPRHSPQGVAMFCEGLHTFAGSEVPNLECTVTGHGCKPRTAVKTTICDPIFMTNQREDYTRLTKDGKRSLTPSRCDPLLS